MPNRVSSWIPALHGYVERGYSQLFSNTEDVTAEGAGEHPCESLEELQQKWKLVPTKLTSFTEAHQELATSTAPVRACSPLKCTTQLLRLVWESGSGCVHVAALIFSISALCVKLTANRVPAFEIVLVRSIICVAATMTTSLTSGVSPLFGQVKNFPVLALRGLVGTTAMTTMYFAVDNLPLPDAITIFFTNPAVTALMAWVILGEQFGWRAAGGCVLSLTGVLLVARPPFIFGGGQVYGPQQVFGVSMAIVSSMFSALAFICVRMIGKKEAALTLALWFHSASFVTSVVPLAAGWPNTAVVPGLRDGALLVAVGFTSFLGQLLINRGFQLEQAAKASSINLMQVLYSYMFGLSVFGDGITILGGLGSLMVSSGVLVINLRACCSRPATITDDAEHQAMLHTADSAGGPGGSGNKLHCTWVQVKEPVTELIPVTAKEFFSSPNSEDTWFLSLNSAQCVSVVQVACGVDDASSWHVTAGSRSHLSESEQDGEQDCAVGRSACSSDEGDSHVADRLMEDMSAQHASLKMLDMC